MGKVTSHTSGDIDTQLGGEGVRAAAPHLFGRSTVPDRPDLERPNTTGVEDAKGALDIEDADLEEVASPTTGYAPGTNVDTTGTLGVATSDDQARAMKLARGEVPSDDPEGRGALVDDHKAALEEREAALADPAGSPIEQALGVGKAERDAALAETDDDDDLDGDDDDDDDETTETETETGDGQSEPGSGDGGDGGSTGDASEVTHQGPHDGGPEATTEGDHVIKPEGSVGDGAPTGEPSGDAQ